MGQMMYNLSDIGQKIIDFRIENGWTQKTLANKIGIAEQQIQRYERTKYQSASLKRITEIINALNGL